MKCGFCKRELEASLAVCGLGYQVSCFCTCGAVWSYVIYSLSCMALVKEPRHCCEAYDSDVFGVYDRLTDVDWSAHK